jgi:tetratricopeptide (TPR) repeat protein
LARIHRGIKALPELPLEEELHRLLDRFEAQPEGRLFAPLADCYRRLGRLDEAYKVCVDGLTRHPRYSTGFVILGKIHLDREEAGEARTAFETVLSIDPENLIALRQLALDAQRRGDPDLARARWEQVLGLDPDGTDAQRALEELGVPGSDAAPTETGEPEASAPHQTPEEPSSPAPVPRPEMAVGRDSGAQENVGGDAEKNVGGDAEKAEVLTAMSREDSLQPRHGIQRTESGDEAETIITVTLADIYCEQGFKAKALEMYRTVLERHPEAARVAGLQEKVDQIEAEMALLARRFQQSPDEVPQAQLEELESAPGADDDDDDLAGDDEGVRKFRAWVKKRKKPGS